ncbi:MarR family transcriptional regulator [Rhodococcus hoagii]|jgi:DNA-binding MarR family transcriptional regulator|uniref:Transcriptional regulator, MarR family n=3 Tax=Rhodococcus hoagii TaxID=43767 RepID=F1TJV1_RHOHA|nr:MarR family transcriptional regulator [Prescottella equi]MBU4614696.1 MarR family transcriptional regulator [Rhodococcus sp. GG48]MCD7049265.1 MarR family transcriptional regulator [Rhodococcus sp. BH2-1]GBF13978.1 multiple antibiotic resistance protein MarR [Rhodococcus sp. Br-6]EGD22405.1 transcriptional regulator, MarR family [Prescottella equi ATCC 33707]ERN46694.1 MarR family transcriptional regulator [Prescottella equi NBRC 101255 = C 7]
MESDPITDLEAELVDMWRRGRIQSRERARQIDPKLDPACYPLLAILTRTDAVPMSALVCELGLEKSTLTRQIDALVRLGLVERRPDPQDARARLVVLTDSGRERLTAQRQAVIAQWHERLSRWDPADVKQLTMLLHRLGESTA